MQKSGLKSSVVAVALVLVLGVASAANANSHQNTNSDHYRGDQGSHYGQSRMHHGNGDKHQHRNGDRSNRYCQNMFSNFNLTAEQQQKITEIRKAQRTTLKSMHASNSVYREMLNSKTFDEAKVRSMLKNQQQQKIEHKIVRLKARYDSFQVLTDAQKADYKMHKNNKTF
ncbi:hypothetical protein JI57_01890 [Psychromonas sp. PRT-SC03]|nr:hypothetical protein JI57_01890 [Psychromonas sp. PRT-SC03]